jgi:hypothetical protein
MTNSDRYEIVDHMQEAVWSVQHNRKVVDPTNELADKIVEFVLWYSNSGSTNQIVESYLELVQA